MSDSRQELQYVLRSRLSSYNCDFINIHLLHRPARINGKGTKQGHEFQEVILAADIYTALSLNGSSGK